MDHRRAFLTRALLLGAGLLSACTDLNGTTPSPLDGVFGDAAVGSDCARPAAGCACSPGSPPVTCFAEAASGGDRVCTEGQRFCRDGAWTACEHVRTFTLSSAQSGAAGPSGVGRQTSALIAAPTLCNPCDPSCFETSDSPNAADLTVDNSETVTYDPAAGGIVLESTAPSGVSSADSDNDGVADIADDFPNDPTRTGIENGLYHVLPFGGPAEVDPLDIPITVRTADIYILMDTSYSMNSEMDNLKQDLRVGTFVSGCSGGIIGAIRCIIPDAWIGIGSHVDYPLDEDGDAGCCYSDCYGAPNPSSCTSGAIGQDRIFEHRLDVTDDTLAAQAAVNSLLRGWGGDLPEGSTQALWAIATGGGLGDQLASRADGPGACSGDRWGYPCFRDGTVPIILHMTDAEFHNGRNASLDYAFTYPRPVGGSDPSPEVDQWVSGNSDYGSAYNVGDITDHWYKYRGDTDPHTWAYNFSCGGWGEDVFFRFTVSRRDTYRIQYNLTDWSWNRERLHIIESSGCTSSSCEVACIGRTHTSDRGFARWEGTLDPGTYYAMLDGRYSSSDGPYELFIGQPSAGIPPTPPPPEPWPYPVAYSDVVTAMNDRGIKYINVNSASTSSSGNDERADARALLNATNSVDAAGSPFLFPIATDGTGMTSAIIDAISELANYSRLDISAMAEDDPSTPENEPDFVTLTADYFDPGRCSGIGSGGTVFEGCLPGTDVRFSASFQNNLLPPSTVARVFSFDIVVQGNGTYELARVPVRIVIPAEAAAFEPEGRYWRDYDAFDTCFGTERPDWSTLSWTATTPSDTSIEFRIQVANDAAGLDSATPVTFTVPPTVPPQDIGTLLVAAGQPNFMPSLRLTTVLRTSTDRASTPVLSGIDLRYSCTPVE